MPTALPPASRPEFALNRVASLACKLFVLLIIVMWPGMIYEWFTTVSDPCGVREAVSGSKPAKRINGE